ncbi:MAG TPA: glutathione S-transferase family protein, partial [Hyphomicrobiaceae bacterium]|nr:glutathione S-transferase family protein [Hyphomicrobiaceae bacterium]
GEAHPGLIDLDAAPRLAVLTVQAEALPAFSEISQPFLPPT